ncbi:hypothetical protein [Streptomyces sp. CBMA156]|uniref:hypothetical protein n=1 Tax=Streptomyces sp. CBMA156 TaxID=1930280 RepID=UPI001661CB93|nr:hypothetical protein [Streptomyces sp. CBMA156]MBD0671233.1 hypothetical protein [Streptomyces sp. CBMA156]
MRITARFAALATVAAIGLGTVGAGTAQAAPAPGQAALTAARSTKVHLYNGTGCSLVRTGYGLAHGIWSQGQEPPYTVGDTYLVPFQSESNGFMTGTEGWVSYQSYNCDDSWRNGKNIMMHWANPYVGSNSYDDYGTDYGIFSMNRESGGGDNADVYWSAMKG